MAFCGIIRPASGKIHVRGKTLCLTVSPFAMKTRVAASQISLPTFQLAVARADEARIRQAYANDDATSCKARISLELRYASLLTATDKFNRKLVSYPADQQAKLHSWLEYKEGFSALYAFWADNTLTCGELKRGADPTGSDEHWKTATRAFDRILDASEKTGWPKPKLSCVATILVDRAAREAALWIREGKLTCLQSNPDCRERRKAQGIPKRLGGLAALSLKSDTFLRNWQISLAAMLLALFAAQATLGSPANSTEF